MNDPIAEGPLSLEQRKELITRLRQSSNELQALADDSGFRYQSLTGSVARLVHDWCAIVEPEFTDTAVEDAKARKSTG